MRTKTLKPNILLVNPPIFDFAAYDFWLKPYGLLSVGGLLRHTAKLSLFDFMDRLSPALDPASTIKTDRHGKGPYPSEIIPHPPELEDIQRHYRRFGIRRNVFRNYLAESSPFDFVLIQTTMTYWYPGVAEVIADVRQLCPHAKIVLGGFYATACTDHAKTLGADVVIVADDLTPLWDLLGGHHPVDFEPAAWELYPTLKTAVMKLTRGCPFRCSYCFVGQCGEPFHTRRLAHCLTELDHLMRLGVDHIAFYDDALLYQPERILKPFLQSVVDNGMTVSFHTPNAMHARYMTAEVADLMTRAGTKTFYLGFESRSDAFHKKTGSGKVVCNELATAVRNLRSAGVPSQNMIAYEILGHPLTDVQQLEASMRFANSLGIRIMLSDFSPIPGTSDGELCRRWVDMDEPLNHNKTAFPIRFLGPDKVNTYKNLCKELNRAIGIDTQ